MVPRAQRLERNLEQTRVTGHGESSCGLILGTQVHPSSFFSIAKLPQERSGCSQEGSAPRPIPKSFPMLLTSGAFPAEPGALVQSELDTGRAPQSLDSRRKAVPGAWGPPTRGYDKPRALMLPGDPSGSAGADGNSLVPRGSSQR